MQNVIAYGDGLRSADCTCANRLCVLSAMHDCEGFRRDADVFLMYFVNALMLEGG